MAGSLSLSRSTVDSAAGALTRLVAMTWTADGAGAVSGHTFSLPNGTLLTARIVPASPTPTDLYDVQLTDGSGLDLLAGTGANRSASVGEVLAWDPPLFQTGLSVDLVVSNAGASASGQVELLIA